MPSTLEVNAGKAGEAYKTLTANLTKIQTAVKSAAKNYETAVSMYWASTDQIKELEAAAKGGKDPKAPVELKKWKDNHPKIAAKLKPLNQEVTKLKEGAAQAKKSAEMVLKTLEGLSKDAARSAMNDVKSTAASLKDLTAGCKLAITTATKLCTTLDSLPKCPAV